MKPINYLAKTMKKTNPFFQGGPYLMGIVNITPDSFFDGGKFNNINKAVEHALQLELEGAHILDVGGESTRPGAKPVSVSEEQDRVLPVIESLKSAGCRAVISVDTRHAATMRAAIASGARMVNDVSALRHDPDSINVLRDSDCLVCLMHMQGDPETMQENPKYKNVLQDVFEFLSSRMACCETSGIAKSRLIVDPGIGFGKTQRHNLELLAGLKRFQPLNVPVTLGASRKSFIAHAAGEATPEGRLPGSIATALYGLAKGVQIFRVHDVAATRQAFAVWRAIENLP